MARLYPPSISGALPSFYGSELTIPFTMNKIVSISEVAGFALRVKSASSETFLFEVTGPGSGTGQIDASFGDTEVTFYLGTAQLNKFIVGEYYKVQIAYVNSLSEIGYYSTVGIIKYTGAPFASIPGFNEEVPNITQQIIIGSYWNEEDPTERESEYRFTIYAADKETELTSTGWTAHVVSNNIETAMVSDSYDVTYKLEQTDQYELKYVLDPMATYYIRYEVRTNNGLYKASPLYEIVENTTMNSTLLADLVAELDYDNACVILTLLPRARISDAIIVGTFEIGRAAEIENYTYWTTISKFSLNGHLPNEGRIFTDFTIEQGQKYKYAIRQLNSYNIYSSWMPITKWRIVGQGDLWHINPYVEAAFEDAYLYDGKRQLRIRFNPKVSSFKTVLMDSKKTAIGNKYPYFFRNGVVGYKEFPISGLISYLSDQDEYFVSRTQELGMPIDWDDSTDITDANLAYERRFKMIVLDWLNKNDIKLYKSPSEGNFLVRLSNVSLSPNDTVSRMLHTFSCTADEVADFSTQKLVDEGFIQVEVEDENLQTLFMTKVFHKGEENPSDIFQGYKGIYIKMEDFLPGSKFRLAGQTYIIGMTGQYELYMAQPANGLSVDQQSLNECWSAGMVPTVTYGIQSKGFTSFDIVTQLSAQKFSYVRRAGPNNNILEPYFDLKHQIERLYYVKFTTKEVIDTNISFQAILKYLEEANKGTMNLAIDVNAVYRIPASDELISYFIANGRITPGEIRHNELVYLYIDNVGSQRYNVHMDKTYSAEVVFGRKLIGVDDIGNRYYDDNIIDLSHTQYYTVDNLNYIPVDDNEKPFIKIGNGVIAEFGLYQKIISYDMEVNVNKVSADNQARFGRLYSAYVTAANNWYGTAARYYVDGAGYREFKNDDPNATGTINQAQKNVLENNYKQARAAYMAILQEELDKRESEAVIV